MCKPYVAVQSIKIYKICRADDHHSCTDMNCVCITVVTKNDAGFNGKQNRLSKTVKTVVMTNPHIVTEHLHVCDVIPAMMLMPKAC